MVVVDLVCEEFGGVWKDESRCYVCCEGMFAGGSKGAVCTSKGDKEVLWLVL
jgi:hypothetical protein